MMSIRKALQAGVNNVGGISFSVADPTALQREARAQAITDAQARAEQLAAGLGAKLGPLRRVSELGGVAVPGPVPMAAVARCRCPAASLASPCKFRLLSTSLSSNFLMFS